MPLSSPLMTQWSIQCDPLSCGHLVCRCTPLQLICFQLFYLDRETTPVRKRNGDCELISREADKANTSPSRSIFGKCFCEASRRVRTFVLSYRVWPLCLRKNRLFYKKREVLRLNLLYLETTMAVSSVIAVPAQCP